MPPWTTRLLATGAPFTKLVRTFADPAENHTGGIYAAAGAWYLGTTRPATVLVGRRSGEFITRRAPSKLRGSGHGHVHQVLRAAYEGSEATAELLTDGRPRLTIDLREALADLPSRLSGAGLRQRLLARWREIEQHTPEDGCWKLAADVSGYESAPRPGKHLYATYLGAPFWAGQMLRRCRRLRIQILAAEAARYAADRRGARGLGFGWPRPPACLGRPDPPRRPG